MHLLFVCTGNICRSPLAERLAAAYAAEAGLEDWLTAESAGVGALVGRPMDADAALVLAGFGGSSSGFRARALTAEHVDRADLVVTMERDHIGKVLERAPWGMRRTATIGELASALSPMPDDAAGGLRAEDVRDLIRQHRARAGRPADPDVPDPYRRGLEVHAQVGEMIVGCLVPVLSRLAGR